MNKDEAKKKLEEADIDADVIKALFTDDGMEAKVAALEAKIEASEGKASGILSDKKKAQQKAEELQTKLDELEGKDLGETERLQKQVEKLQAQVEAEIQQKTELEENWKTDKRNAQLTEIGTNFKWLDTVPEKMRKQVVESEFADLDDLSNEVLVKDRLKTVSESYAGMLAADAPRGAGSKSGSPSQSKGAESFKTTDLKDIAKNPQAYVQAAMAASED